MSNLSRRGVLAGASILLMPSLAGASNAEVLGEFIQQPNLHGDRAFITGATAIPEELRKLLWKRHRVSVIQPMHEFKEGGKMACLSEYRTGFIQKSISGASDVPITGRGIETLADHIAGASGTRFIQFGNLVCPQREGLHSAGLQKDGVHLRLLVQHLAGSSLWRLDALFCDVTRNHIYTIQEGPANA